MRIISGKFKGLLIQTAKKDFVRPTQDRVRENIFNILGDISGLKVLDLFSGTGSLGLESLSRSASEVVFCDKEKYSINLTESNLKFLTSKSDKELISKAKFINGDYLKTIGALSCRGEKFDIIFIDPPYAMEGAKDCPALTLPILNNGGIIIFETDIKDLDKFFSENFEIDKRRYGSTFVYFLSNNKPN
jgi:16S rRNA (guanine(966)-N(2))-methyltransferase RsmD